METSLTSVSWLKENLNNPKLVLLDATIPVVTESTAKNSAAAIIKSARFFDLKQHFSDANSTLPNTMPSPKVFEESCRDLGINTDSEIVVYDSKGIYSSPRVWFMFKAMGHEKVSVLNGGLPEWVRLEGSITTLHDNKYGLGNFKANYDPSHLKSANYLLENINSKDKVVIDARSEDRFLGKVAEPRADLKRGHIPNSLNLPFTTLLNDSKFLPAEDLRNKFEALELDNTPLIFSCGSGLTACITLLAASMVLKNDLFLYDGSWTEWGDGDIYPISAL